MYCTVGDFKLPVEERIRIALLDEERDRGSLWSCASTVYQLIYSLYHTPELKTDKTIVTYCLLLLKTAEDYYVLIITATEF